VFIIGHHCIIIGHFTNNGFWHIFASTSAALIITLITIAYQALKAARANAVEALRYE
jgi:ABC-type lipoprotein release transport system permease subunit